MKKYIFEIREPRVISKMTENKRLREEFLKRSLAAAKNLGIKIGIRGDNIDGGTIECVAVEVPESDAKNWRKISGRYVPKKNTKRGAELFNVISAMTLDVPDVIGLIESDLGVKSCMFMEACLGGGVRLLCTRAGMAADKFVCFAYTNDGEPEPKHENYSPLKDWEYKKLIEEGNGHENS